MGVFKDVNVSTLGLRDCQSEACEAARQHYSTSTSDNHTLIQLPTGTGKSGLIAALPFCLNA